MIPALEQKREEIASVCRRHRVRRLDLFGSAAKGEFDAQTSDVDFLVEFHPLGPGERADAYFGLFEDLEQLLQRPADLVMERAISNPYFRQSAAQTRQVLYAASDLQAAGGCAASCRSHSGLHRDQSRIVAASRPLGG